MVRHRPARKKVQEDDANRVFPAKKVSYRNRANKYFDEYDKMIVVCVDNVQSRQMQTVREQLRGIAVVMMGKNTTIRKILLDRTKANPDCERSNTMYAKISPLLIGNVGLVFTNDDLNKVKDVVDANLITAMARQGTIAPVDVFIPAGNTGMDPNKTSFFQALNIGTKITKGTVEILKEEKVITAGDKVGSSQATLLQMLNIKPFHYGLEIKQIYDQGAVYGRDILEMTDELMLKKVQAGIANVTGLALATGITCDASMPHVVMNAFKNLLAVCVATEFSFSACNGEELREAIISGKGIGGGGAAAAAPAAAAAAAAPAAAAAAPVEEEEDEDDDMGFGLFD